MRHKYRALYIDDKAGDKLLLAPTIEDVEKASIRIKPELPQQWDEMVKDLEKRLKDFDCLILDWRLNEVPVQDGKRVRYKASEVAQYLRRRIVEGDLIKPIPIFLWSTDDQLKSSFYGDITSQDLFDEIYKKDTDLVDFPIEKGLEMRSFIEAYIVAADFKSRYDFNFLVSLLKPDDVSFIDSRVEKYISGKNEATRKQARVFPFIKLLYKDIVKTSGMLISPELLAIRLGIDVSKSPDWKKLLSRQKFKGMKFKGLFGSIYERFWMQGLFQLWRQIGTDSRSLIMIPPEEKVAVLRKHFKLKRLKHLEPTKLGTNFWVLDELTGKPLDIDNAELVSEREPLPWQERLYKSKDWN